MPGKIDPRKKKRLLREKAEAKLRKKGDKDKEAPEKMTPAAMKDAIHELKVHQIELEMQNEELRRTQEELETARANYFDLYDLAPVGYVTISEKGLVNEANFVAAELLCAGRADIVKHPFTGFIIPEDQDIYYLHRNELFKTGQPQVCELRMTRAGKDNVWVRLFATRAVDTHGAPVCRAVMVNITDRKLAEDEAKRLFGYVISEKDRLRSLVNSIPDEVWFTDMNKKFILANPVARARFGVDTSNGIDIEMKNLAGSVEVFRPDMSLRPPEEAQPLRALSGEVIYCEEEIVRTPATGELRHRLVSSAPVHDASGDIIGAVSVVRDITELKRGEEKTRVSEEKFRLIAQLAPAGIYLTAPNGECHYVNERWIEMAGLTIEEALGNGWVNGIHPEDRAMVLESWDRMVSSRGHWGREYRFMDKEGRTTWVYGLAAPQIGSDGNIIGYVGMNIDITARMRSDEELRVALREAVEARVKTETIIAAIRDGISIHDREFRIVYQNEILEKTFGRHVGEHCYRVYESKESRCEGCPVQMAFEDGKVHHSERVVTVGGETRYYENIASPLRDADGTVIAGIEFVRDITARKRADDALRESQFRLELTQRAAGAGMWDWEFSSGELKWSNELYRMFGRVPDETTASFESWRQVVHPEDLKGAEYRIEEAVKTGKPLENEYRVILSSGETRWINALGSVVYDAERRPVRMTGICLDITERKRSEEAIKESEERFRSLFDNALNAVAIHEIILDDKGRPVDYVFLQANPGFDKHTGTRAADIIGKRVTETHPGIERTGLIEKYGKVALTGEPISFEMFVEPSNRYFNISAYRVAKLRFAAVFEDITERKIAEEELKESEKRFRDITFSMADWVWEVDRNGVYTFSSHKDADLLGRSSEEVLGKTPLDFMEPGEAKRVGEIFSGITSRKEPIIDIENWNIHKNGEKVCILTNGVPILDKDGALKGYRGVDKDITESKRAEEAMRFQAEITKNLNEGIYLYRLADRVIFYANPNFEKMFGYGPGELNGREVSVLNEPDHKTPGEKRDGIVDALDKKSEWHGEVRNIRKDGTPFWCYANVAVFDHPEYGKVCISVHTDITERKIMEDAQAFLSVCGYTSPHEDFFQLLAQYLARTLGMDYICIDQLEGDGLNARTLAVYHNGKFEDNVEYTLKDTPCGDVVGKDICCFERDVCRLFPNDAALRELEAESYIGTTLYGFEGKPIGLIAVIGKKPMGNKRVSEMILKLVAVRAAGELERMRAEEALERSRDAAEAAAKAKSEFLTNIAHDFRTPVHIIQGFSLQLLSRELSGEEMEWARIIDRTAGGLIGLVEELLDVSRLESGKAELRQVGFDMNKSVAEAVANAKLELGGKEVAVSCSVDDGIPLLKGDSPRISQILANILGNAVKYTDKGEITVNLSRDREKEPTGKCRVKISVRDTGLGIPAEKLPRIYDAFTRFHEFDGGKARKGEGLGLYITRTLIDMMRGEISVKSEVGVGSEFVVTLDLDIA
ncbi:MAG: PAS domain S-box protein [Candidatus Omnitrophica bacterium]|nr:PAS domain S-box protein [Candidatus Omnitrophota bacterium]